MELPSKRSSLCASQSSESARSRGTRGTIANWRWDFHLRGGCLRDEERGQQAVLGFEDAVGEAGLVAAGAGDELGGDRADQREAAADPQSGEEIRQRGRHSQETQFLPGRGAVKLEQRDEIAVGAIE